MKVAAFFVLLCALFLAGDAYTIRQRPAHTTVLRSEQDIQTAPSTDPSIDDSQCFYLLYLTNYDDGGFGNATVRLTVNGKPILGFSEAARLPPYVRESGWEIPVLPGEILTVEYLHDGVSNSSRSLKVADANGLVIYSRSYLDASFSEQISITCDCVYQTVCPSIRVRNEWRSLSYCEKKNYMDAIRIFRFMKDGKGENMFDKFVVLHYLVTLPFIAAKNLLLPWHRLMILTFEDKLRALGGRFSCLSLPYWDWTLDFGNEFDSKVISDFGGVRENSCLDVPFQTWYNPSLANDCVARRSSVSGAPFTVALTARTAVEFGIASDKAYIFIFKYMVRAPHKAPHMFLEGDMKTFASPADPLFWLHHASVDRMWSAWQDCWEYDKDDEGLYQYQNVSNTDVNTLMPKVYPDAENATIKSTFNIFKLGYTYSAEVDPIYRLNRDHAVTTQTECHWDWLSRSVHEDMGLNYRIAVHNDVQRQTLSAIRAHYTAALETSGDYAEALRSKLRMECELANANDYSKYSDLVEAKNDPLPGPSYLFNNLCRIQENHRLNDLFYM